MKPTLLIDGRNAIYRSVFAGKSDSNFQQNGHNLVNIFFRSLHRYIADFDPASVHVFWDCPSKDNWRLGLYPEYKDRSAARSAYDFDVDGAVRTTEALARSVLEHMNVRQYGRPKMEADDLIYAFSRTVLDDVIILSNDGDLLQIPYFFRHARQYHPSAHKFYDRPDHDPIIRKCLMGDKSDNIPGYTQIGKKRSLRLTISHEDRGAFLENRGKELYERNRLLIDLSLCPELLNNMLYIEGELSKSEPPFDETAVLHTIMEQKIRGLRGEFSRCILPFKWLKDKEGDIIKETK